MIVISPPCCYVVAVASCRRLYSFSLGNSISACYGKHDCPFLPLTCRKGTRKEDQNLTKRQARDQTYTLYSNGNIYGNLSLFFFFFFFLSSFSLLITPLSTRQTASSTMESWLLREQVFIDLSSGVVEAFQSLGICCSGNNNLMEAVRL